MEMKFLKKSEDNHPDLLPPFLKWIFMVILALKIGSAILAWFLNEPWSLGFWVPLGFMSVYLTYGALAVRNKSYQVKTVFGDSCYYLGFVFTIASIILAMADFDSVHVDIGSIAIRFAAAMVTTGVGMAFRICYVTFGQEEDKLAGFLSENLGEKAEFRKPEPVEVSSSDPTTIVIQATAHNLRELNAVLVESVNAFNRTRADMLSLAGNIQGSLKQSNAETLAALKSMKEQVENLMGEASQAFQDNLDSQFKASSENNKKLMEQQQVFSLGVKKTMESSAAGMVESFAETRAALSAQISQLVRQVKRSDENMGKAADSLLNAVDGLAQKMNSDAVSEAISKLTSALGQGTLEASNAAKAFSTEFSNTRVDLSPIEKSAQAAGMSIRASTQGLADAIDKFTASLERVKSLEQLSNYSEDIKHSLQAVTQEAQALKDQTRTINESLNGFEDKAQAIASSADKVVEELHKPFFHRFFN